jgi:ribosomal protein S12 methylthiotransferase accessory factor YcaO
MDGRQRAIQFQGLTEFFERQVWFLAQQSAHQPIMGWNNHRLAPGAVMAGTNVPGVSALLKELLDHAK